MSTNGYPPASPSGAPLGEWNSALLETLALEPPRPKHRYWLHALLLLLTLGTTSVVGAGLAQSFAGNRPFDFDADIVGYMRLWHDPMYLLTGLPFSLTLLAILMCHEMGHYLAARYYGVDVTLPFFLPAPTLIGTFGAFIRIRSPIPSKRALFDIGIGGPLAGFVALVLPMVAGLSLSKVVPGIAGQGDLVIGTPVLLRAFEWIQFPGAAAGDIYLHPVARAAWVGLLTTGLNLLPIGQLDGGHVLYAFVGERSRWLSLVFIGILVPMGIFVAYMWLVWAVLLFFFARRHPAIYDPRPLGRARNWLGLAALGIFIVSFMPVPVRTM